MVNETETAEKKDGARRGIRRKAVGLVVGAKRNKTISVEVKRVFKHPRYGKYIYRSLICHAHDEKNEAGAGDQVEIQGTRPLSKQKRWRLVRILERAALPEKPARSGK